MSVLDEASVLKCISNLAKYDEFNREYKLLLVSPQILEDVSKLERVGNYRVKTYVGNDDKQNGFSSSTECDWTDGANRKTRELSVILSEKSPTLQRYMTHMQYLSRFEIKKPRLLMFNKEHYEEGQSGLRENMRQRELDLTGKTNMFINNILER